MDKSIDYYTNIMGLELVGRTENQAYFKAWDEYDHHFELPTGHLCELYYDINQVGTKVGTLNPDPWPDDVKGIAPHRLDHIAVTGEDVNHATRFFTEVLDFGQSEKIIAGENGEIEMATDNMSGEYVQRKPCLTKKEKTTTVWLVKLILRVTW